MDNRTRRVLLGNGVRDMLRVGSDDDLYATHYGAVLPEAVILGTNSNTNTANTSHNFTLPANIRAGEMIFIFANLEEVAWSSISTPGYDVLENTDGGVNGLLAMWKIADGTEGGTNVVATSGSSRVSCAVSLRIGGHAGAKPVTTITSTGTGATTRDMPAHAQPFSRDALILVCCGIGGSASNINPSGYPSGYTYIQVHTNIAGSSNDAGIAVGARKNVDAAGDPGNFTYGGSVAYVGITAVIKSGGGE